ncbi:MAG: hypothetical protein ACRC3H_16750 [Lachnospiraceae bacterium]
MVIHLGDHDPSGIDMSRDIQERNVLFDNLNLEFHRIALNKDQIDLYNPPPNPTKLTDSRASGYISHHGYECWELDALEPRVLTDLIQGEVLKYRDDAIYQKVKKQEEEERGILESAARHWDVIESNWEEIKKQYVYGEE